MIGARFRFQSSDDPEVVINRSRRSCNPIWDLRSVTRPGPNQGRAQWGNTPESLGSYVHASYLWSPNYRSYFIVPPRLLARVQRAVTKRRRIPIEENAPKGQKGKRRAACKQSAIEHIGCKRDLISGTQVAQSGVTGQIAMLGAD